MLSSKNTRDRGCAGKSPANSNMTAFIANALVFKLEIMKDSEYVAKEREMEHVFKLL